MSMTLSLWDFREKSVFRKADDAMMDARRLGAACPIPHALTPIGIFEGEGAAKSGVSGGTHPDCTFSL